MTEVTPKQAAAELHMTAYSLKTMMRMGLINIGQYVKQEEAKNGRYIIWRKLLDEEKKRLGVID